MSVRRKVDDVVVLQDDVEGPYLARIVPHGGGTQPDSCMYECGDPHCGEWPVVHVLNADGTETVERVFHVSECGMFPPMQYERILKDWLTDY